MRADIALIYPGTRLRGPSQEQVAALADSIAEVGLLSPITVYERNVMHQHVMTPGFGLIAGLNRLEACKKLGFSEIDVHVVTIDDLSRQIAECDENLCGTKLSPAERASFTSRRKDAYKAKYPSTAHGGDRKSSPQVEGLKSFASDTAEKTGASRQTVERDARRGEKIDAAVLASIAGTDLDTGIVLDSLAAIPKEDQAKVVANMKAAPKKAPAPKQAPAIVKDDVKPDEAQRDGIDDVVHQILTYLPDRVAEKVIIELWSANYTTKQLADAMRRHRSDVSVYPSKKFAPVSSAL